MLEQDEKATRRRRMMRLGALAGAVLALVCHCVPPKYQAACNAVSQIASLSCGAPAGGH